MNEVESFGKEPIGVAVVNEEAAVGWYSDDVLVVAVRCS